jgi:Holliday junction resolvase
MSRNKGQVGERELLKLLGEELGVELSRNLLQTRESGADCLGIRGFAVEVKRQERLCLPAWWRQAVKQGEMHGAEPILAFRQNRQPWRFLLKTQTGYREENLIGAAEHIREKWACLYGIYTAEAA